MAQNISLVTSNQDGGNLHESQQIQDLIKFIDQTGVNWITCNRLDDRPTIEEIIGRLGLDRSLADEITDSTLWEVKETGEGCLFLKLAILARNLATGELQEVRASFVLGTQYVLLFHNGDANLFAKTRKRLLDGKFREKQWGADFLIYLLLREWTTDHYYSLLKGLHGRIHRLEEELLNTRGEDSTYTGILNIRMEIGRLGDYLLTCFEFMDTLKTIKTAALTPSTLHYFTQSLPEDMAGFWREYKGQRETLKELLEIHQTLVTNKMSRGLQLLTAIVILFLPVTFIAGLFSMNFRYMPDREWPWSYPLILIVIALIIVSMVLVLKRRKML
jgi:magnesium transporter